MRMSNPAVNSNGLNSESRKDDQKEALFLHEIANYGLTRWVTHFAGRRGWRGDFIFTIATLLGQFFFSPEYYLNPLLIPCVIKRDVPLGNMLLHH